MTEAPILVAGVGNVFLGDDGFGVETVRRLAGRTLPSNVRVADFGIRGLDLAYALLERYELVIVVDASRRGGVPGTLYLLESDPSIGGPAELETHAMVPARAFRLAHELGASIRRLLIVACEPESFGEPGVGRMGLSPRVEAAVPQAVQWIESVVRQLDLAPASA